MKKSAFTLIEMIFVIIVLSIVTGMTFIQLSSVYEDLLQKQTVEELESEADIILDQIIISLSSSVKDSLVAMTNLDGSDCTSVSSSLDGNKNYILAWVGKSTESYFGIWDKSSNTQNPGWSGFVDVDGSDTNGHTYIITKGSKLSDAEKIIDQFIGKQNPYSLSQTSNSPVALYFTGSSSSTDACNDFFNQTADKMYQVKKNGDTRLDFIGSNKPDEIVEQYTLSHFAYAIAKNDTNLYLYSFRPWLGENPDNDKNPQLIGENIAGFGFKWNNGLFRINICLSKKMIGDYEIEVCKERAVF